MTAMKEQPGGKTTRPSARDKAEATDHVARSIIDAELAARLKKTERLKALRLKKVAEEETSPEKPAVKAKRKRPA
jgi:hypothetical protein